MKLIPAGLAASCLTFSFGYLAQPANACRVNSPFVIEDIREADVVFSGRLIRCYLPQFAQGAQAYHSEVGVQLSSHLLDQIYCKCCKPPAPDPSSSPTRRRVLAILRLFFVAEWLSRMTTLKYESKAKVDLRSLAQDYSNFRTDKSSSNALQVP